MSFMTRRMFLALAGGAALAAPRKVIVAGHPWVYAAKLPDYNPYPVLDQIFADMKYAGLDAIELMDSALTPDGAVERVRELSRRNGLPVLGTSWGANMWRSDQYDAITAEAATLVKSLAAVGGRTLGVSVGNARKPKTGEQFDAQAKALRKVMAICADHGVVLNLHNHTYEVSNNEHDLRGTLERVPEVKLGPDLNWLLRGGVDPIDFIRRHGKRIVFAHLRDQKADGKWPEAMGEGAMDYAAIGKALREVGFAGDVAIELAHERDFERTRPLRESLKMSRSYVRKTVGY